MTEAEPIHLISCVGVKQDLALLDAFVRHYAELGVPRANMHFILQAEQSTAPELERARTLLGHWEIEPADLWFEPYTSAAMWKRRRAVQRARVAATDWVISADVDEFHRYPAPLAEVTAACARAGANCVQGPLIDRIAADGQLVAPDPERPLFEQFPLEGDLMCTVGKERGADDAHGTVKMMLFRGEVFPGQGGHNPANPEAARFLFGRGLSFMPGIKRPEIRFAVPMRVLHFKWRAGLMAGLRARSATPGASTAGSVYGERLLDYLDRHGNRIEPRDFVRDTSAVPSPDSWWRDVVWLRAQARAPSRGVARSAERAAAESEAIEGRWRLRQLTHGSADRQYHSHSYYDIHVLGDGERLAAAHRMDFAERWMTAEDRIAVGTVDVERGGFTACGESRAWSWQQGPMAQFVPGTRSLIWNDREGEDFVARLHNLDDGRTRTLPRPVYAIDPTGRFALSTNMARLDAARPGYGYVGGRGARLDRRSPADDGIWSIDFETGESRLILSLADAAMFLMAYSDPETRAEHTREQHLYWFNHIKLSPDGRRFTTKLRWREKNLQGRWTGKMGVSLTCNVDGTGLRLLARASSHVMWLDVETLYLWKQDRGRLMLIRDDSPFGEPVQDLFPELIGKNVHIRHIPLAPEWMVYDTPYLETIDLYALDTTSGAHEHIGRFDNHKPNHGPFRCDLHPVPSTDGRRVIVTSLHDGGRQLYVAEREDALA